MAYRKGVWQPKSKEEKQKELDELIELSNKKIEEYRADPKDMIEFAKFMSKIHNYSPLNLSLIDEQFEGAIAVGSYKMWSEQGFSVRKGEKGIGIYTHAPVTIFIDEEGKEKTLREATAEEKKKIKSGELSNRRIEHFKKGYVFDVSQTTATEEDLPKIFPNRVWNFKVDEETNLDQLERGVDTLANELGISIKDMRESMVGELGSARGAYFQYVDGTEEIALNFRNSRTQNIATSIHELAHKKMHNRLEKGASYPTEIKEFQAELTSFVVCNNYGIDTSDFTIPYVANWTKNNEKINSKEFRSILGDIKSTALEFIESLDRSIIEQREIMSVEKDYEKKTSNEAQSALKNSFANDGKEVEKKNKIFENQVFDRDSYIFFKNGNFDGYRFVDCTFDKVNMSNSSFKNTVFEKCNFEFANMENNDFTEMSMYDSTIHGGSMRNSNLKNSTIWGTKIDYFNMSNVNLLSTTFEDVDFSKIKIGQSIQNLDCANFYLSGATAEESKVYQQINLEKLNRINFNSEFNPDTIKLPFREYFSDPECPEREILRSYFEGMIEFYKEKNPQTEIKVVYREYDVTAKIGKNYATYMSDVKQFDICDMYGVTAENTSIDENDHLILDRTPENCDYVEAFIHETIRAESLEKQQIQKSEVVATEGDVYHFQKSELPTPLKVIATEEAVYNLSDSAKQYYDLKEWSEEFTAQSEIDNVEQLLSCNEAEEFYEKHKQEIENKVDDFEKATGIDFRSQLSESNYQSQVATLAYKIVAVELKNEIEESQFEIPLNSKLKKEELSLSYEME